MIQLVGTLRQQARCRLQSLHEALDHAPGGRLEFHVFAVLAVFICELPLQAWQVLVPDVLTSACYL